MKKKYFILILCLSIIFVSGKAINSFDDSNLIPIKDLNIFKKQNSIIYLGRPTCPICCEFLPILESVLEDENKKIYYFNTDIWRDKKGYESIIDSYQISSVPTIIKINKSGSFEQLDLFDSSIDFLKDTNQLKNDIKKFIN